MKNIRNIFRRLTRLENRNMKFIRVLIVFISPITNDLDYRVAYFIDSAEAREWQNTMIKKYSEHEFEFSIYVDYVEVGK